MKFNVSVVSMAAVLASACASSPPPAPVDAPPVTVSLGRAEIRDLPSSFEAGGAVRARSVAVIASRVMAPVTEVLVRPGDRVLRGAPLVRLDAREINASGARASAGLDAARQSADAAASDTRAAEAAVRIARLTHERIAALHDKRSATTQELDQATAGLTTAEAQLTGSVARAAAATAARREAQAVLQGSEIATSYTVLTAPFDGLVTERTIDPGTMATPGAPLLTLENPGTFTLEVRLDAARAALVATGQTAAVNLSESPELAVNWRPARIVEIGRLDATSHGFIVKLEVPDATRVRSGQFGRARFQGPARPTLTVPATALLRRGQMTFVFAVEGNDIARLRPVSVGAIAGERVELLAGVRDGERVVTNPPVTLIDGSHIIGGQ